jgi:hypothetical protein
VFASGTSKTGFTVPVKYEGGNLPLTQNKIKATVAEDQIILVQGKEKVVVPVRNIVAVTCGTDVRRRFGASVLGVVPLMHLDKAERYYVGMTVSSEVPEGGKSSKMEVVFQMNNSEYRDFLAALERITGLKAINTGKVPTVVRYML